MFQYSNMAYLHIYKYSCQARSDKRICYRTNNYQMPHGHLIWTLTRTSYFKYKLQQLLFVCVAGKPVSKHIYIYTFGEKPVFYKYVYTHSYKVNLYLYEFICLHWKDMFIGL